MSGPKHYNVKEFYVLEKFCRRMYIWPDCKLVFGYLHPFAFSVIVQFIAGTLHLVHLIQSFKADAMKVFLEDLLLVICVGQFVFPEVMYLICREKFIHLLCKIDNLQGHDVPIKKNQFAKRIKARMIWIIVIYITALVTCIGGGVYFYAKFCKRKSLAGIDLVTPWFPWNQEIFTNVFISCVCLFAMQAGLMCITLLSCQITFLEFLIFRLLSLASFVSEIDFRNREGLRQQLRKCVLFYNDLVRLNRRANFCWSRCEQFAHLGYSFVLSLAVIIFFLNPTYRAPFIVIVWLAVYLIHYYVGQRLIDASNVLVDAAYRTNWYEGDNRSQKDFLIFMILIQKPLRISYRLLEEVSHSSLSKVTKVFN